MKILKIKKLHFILFICLQFILVTLFSNDVFATTNNWDMSTSTGYTASNATSFTFSGGIANLNYNPVVDFDGTVQITDWNGVDGFGLKLDY